MTLAEVRVSIEGIDNFYSDGVAFEGSMARCPWEVGVEIESDSDSSKEEPEELTQQEENRSEFKSYWSTDSDSEMKFVSPSTAQTDRSSWMDYSTCGASWNFENSERSSSPSPPPEGTFAMYDAPPTPPSTYSNLSTHSSLPVTPEGIDISMEYKSNAHSKSLRVNTDCSRRRFYEGSIVTPQSAMQTAVESSIYDPFSSSSFFLASPPASAASMGMPSAVDFGSSSTRGSEEVNSMSTWDCSGDDGDDEASQHPSMSTDRPNSILELDEEFDAEDMIVSPDMQNRPETPLPPISTLQPGPLPPAFSLFHGTSSSNTTAPTPSSAFSKKSSDDKSKGGSLFSSIKFAFPRSPRASAISIESSHSGESSASDSFVPLQTLRRTPSPSTIMSSWHMRSSPKPTPPINIPDSNCRGEARLVRSKRHYWFSPGKLFAAGAQ
jgi:hypothetical protein